MGLKGIFARTSLAKYSEALRAAPREVIWSPVLLGAAFIYAAAAIPLTWDQGAGSAVPSLAGFQHHFGISSGSNAGAIKNFVSLVYIGDAVGAALSFLINDQVGRRWAYRIYLAVWALGYIVLITSPNVAGLYASRVISGLGIGALSVVGPLAIIEIAPPQIRGVLGAWYTVCQLLALMTSTFCIYGVQLHIEPSRLQYQVVYIVPIVFMALLAVASFFIPESPRWLLMIDRYDEARNALVTFRRLPETDPRLQEELDEIVRSLRAETELTGTGARSFHGIKMVVKEMFTVKANLRRLQQILILYMLPQLSGGNSFTNYFIPIVKIVGAWHNATHGIFLNALYGTAKFVFSLIASFLLIDVIGRRGSLFLGVTIQLIADIYLAVYTKVNLDGGASRGASEGALAFVFIQAFGYTTGLLTLPYVLGSEIWPNRVRSLGAALSQTFHWLFHFSMTYAVPSLLARTNNWGGFIFFAVWCVLALLYVYLMVPEVANLTMEEIDHIYQDSHLLLGRRYKGSSKPKSDESQVLDGLELEYIASNMTSGDAKDKRRVR
ncbi:hypothetical protein PRZ48_012875 [Zasmidium cellare]|uniref:Major facilitator superfamily (MFS) profile domain-containing protein n=1 Tax=Zasmidium cellare TaxID=395010 RepID=A0ABR0E2F3_ZASCE|nr:hypothetical protein PRZ48_012875 [Zasmidium cellare]